jgi:dTDP-4-dehydrorhamnose reductase
VFGDAPQLFTQTILDKLHALAESPWADWSYGKPFSARDLADMLKEHQVKSHQVRIGEDSRKGYRRADLEDAWARYLPGEAKQAKQAKHA